MKRTHPLAVFAIAIAAVAAVAFACPADAAPDRPGVTPELIQGAIVILEFNRDDAQWTKSGKPRVDAIEALLEADISAADRDAAWKALKEPPPAVGVVEVEPDPELLARVERAERARDDAIATRVALSDANTALGLERDGWRGRAETAETSLTALRSSMDDQIETAWRDAAESKRRYDSLMAAAVADREDAATDARAARIMKSEAADLLAEAQTREAGAGPPARKACRDAVSAIVHGKTGWLSNDVSVDPAGRKVLSDACLAH